MQIGMRTHGQVDAGNLKRIGAAPEHFGFAEGGQKIERLHDGRRLLQLGSEPNRVDLLNFASGVTFTNAMRQPLPRISTRCP